MMRRKQPDRIGGTSSCPTPEILSALVDGEAPESVLGHVRRCRRCARIVYVYRRIDMVSRQAAAPPEGLSVRILQQCRDAAPASREGKVFWISSRFLAAWKSLDVTGNAPEIAAGRSGGQPGRTIAGREYPAVPDGALTPLPPSGMAVSEADIAPAAVGHRQGGGRQRRIRAVRIPSRVTHVWVVDDIQRGRQFLEQHLPDGAMIAGESRGDGHVRDVTIAIRDDRLPSLVKELAAGGWKLLSPAPPQPDAGRNVAWLVRRQPVYYSVRLVDAASP